MHLCVALKAVIWLVYTSMWPQIWLLWTSVHVPHMRCTLARQFAVTCSCEWAVLAACMQVFCFAVWVASFRLAFWADEGPHSYHKISYCTGLIGWLPLLWHYLEDSSICCQKGTLLHCLQYYVQSASLAMLFAYCLPVRLTSISLLVCNGPLHLYSYVYIVHMLVSTCACMSTAEA